MPYGAGTYGNTKGRPPVNKNEDKKPSNLKNTIAANMKKKKPVMNSMKT
jgi:hypothetical protein